MNGLIVWETITSCEPISGLANKANPHRNHCILSELVPIQFWPGLDGTAVLFGLRLVIFELCEWVGLTEGRAHDNDWHNEAEHSCCDPDDDRLVRDRLPYAACAPSPVLYVTCDSRLRPVVGDVCLM
jgi:hypothetical protein